MDADVFIERFVVIKPILRLDLHIKISAVSIVCKLILIRKLAAVDRAQFFTETVALFDPFVICFFREFSERNGNLRLVDSEVRGILTVLIERRNIRRDMV